MEKVVVVCNNCSQKLRIPKEGNYEVTCPKCTTSRVFLRDSEGINILVIGKSGIGKSKFCNYIFNSEVFNSGSGKPVTTWNENFQHHVVDYDNYSLNIFDSVGIENTNLPDWRARLHNFLDQHSFLKAVPKKWVHGVFYLVSAASARIEEIEVGIISDLVQRHIPVQVILSKADQAKPEEILSLKKQITAISPSLGIHEVCSVDVRKRVGSVERYGRENILNSFLIDLDEKLKYGILQYALFHYIAALKQLSKKLTTSIDKSDFGLFTLIKEIYSDSNRDIDEIFNIDTRAIDVLSKQSEEALNELDAFLLSYGYSSENSARRELHRIDAEIDAHLDRMSENLDKKLADIESKFDGGVIDMISGAWDAGKILFDLKGFILGLVNDLTNPLISKLEFKAKKYGVK